MDMREGVLRCNTWKEITWIQRRTPGTRIWGWSLPETREVMTASVVRLGPKHFRLESAKITPMEVIQKGKERGLEYCPDQLVDVIISSVYTKHAGYIVAPTSSETVRILLAWQNQKISKSDELRLSDLKPGYPWSVIMVSRSQASIK